MIRSQILGLLVLGVLSACAQSKEDTGGESNWVECAEDADCEDGERCQAARCALGGVDASSEPAVTGTELHADEAGTNEEGSLDTVAVSTDTEEASVSGAQSDDTHQRDASAEPEAGGAGGDASTASSSPPNSTSSDANGGASTDGDGASSADGDSNVTEATNSETDSLSAGGTGSVNDAGGDPLAELFTLTLELGPSNDDWRVALLAGETLYLASETELWARTGETWSIQELPDWSSQIRSLALSADGRLVLGGGNPGAVFVHNEDGWSGSSFEGCELSGQMEVAPGPGDVLFGICSSFLLQIDENGSHVIATEDSPNDLVYVSSGPQQGLHVLLYNQVASYFGVPFSTFDSAPPDALRDLPTLPETPFFSFSTLGALPDGSLLAQGGSGMIVGDQGGVFEWESPRMIPSPGTLTDLAASGDIAVAVGTMGLLMLRQDARWVKLPPPSAEALYSVSLAADGAHFVAVGDSGVIVEGRR